MSVLTVLNAIAWVALVVVKARRIYWERQRAEQERRAQEFWDEIEAGGV